MEEDESIDQDCKFYKTLIQTVRGYKCLYDKSDVFYYNQSRKNSAWAAVAEICERPPVVCKNRWKLFRERFCKELKKFGSSVWHQHSEWIFFEELYFLKECILPRRKKYYQLDKLKSNHSCEEDHDEEEKYDAEFDFGRESPDKSFTSEQLDKQPYPAPAKKPKVSCGNKKFNARNERLDTLQEEEKDSIVGEAEVPAVDQLLEAQSSEIDELFLKNMLALMKDLPIAVKDKFQADMYCQIFNLREKVRQNKH